MHVAFSSDNNYANYLKIAILSLLDNNKIKKQINIHILDNGISDDNKKCLEGICNRFKSKINFYDLKEINKILKKNNIEGISIASYSRLFLSELLDESIEKVIYMDVDSLILGELNYAYNLDMRDNLIAAVEDIVPFNFKEVLSLNKSDRYVNAGFLVINLKEWRRVDFISKALKILKNYNGNKIHHDQGVINKICNGKIIYLAPKYNSMTPFYKLNYNAILKFYGLDSYYSKEIINEAIKKPIFIHFTPAFDTRPWEIGCNHPAVYKYYEYIKKCDLNIDNILIKSKKNLKIKIIERVIRIYYNFRF